MRRVYKPNKTDDDDDGHKFRTYTQDFDFACSICGYKKHFPTYHDMMVHVKEAHPVEFSKMDIWYQEMALDYYERKKVQEKRYREFREQEDKPYKAARVF